MILLNQALHPKLLSYIRVLKTLLLL